MERWDINRENVKFGTINGRKEHIRRQERQN
jgi:hypothetical protein